MSSNPDADDTEQTLTIEAPERVRPDEEIPLGVTGVAPGATVEFTASMADADGCTWRSEATFRAREDGTVDLTEQPPVAGSYEGVAPMGWLWSMATDDEDRLVTELMHTESTTIHLQATTPEQTATCRVERGFADEAISRTDVSTDEFVGTIFEPDDRGPHPGVLVLHGSGGHSPVFEAALLAAHGFSAFALQYIGEAEILPEHIVEIPVTYFDDAATWFTERDAVGPDPLGIVGHSRGAEIGLWLGANREWAGPVVSYAGSPVLWDTPSGDPAWLDASGQPLPAVSGQGKPTLCEGQLDEATPETRVAATTQVSAIDGPVLFISGGEDPIWPATRLAELGVERLDEAGFAYAYDHLTDEDAGHFITPPYLPKSHDMLGGTAAATAHIDATTWPVVREYLDS